MLTDKTGTEAVRSEVLARLVAEIGAARAAKPDLKLLLGHGSGSFGHVAASKHNTRQGVGTADGWLGFAEVSDSAARLNRLVVEGLLAAGVAAVTIQPSASAVCEAGQIVSMAVEPLSAALEQGLVPVVYGDVAFDSVWGGTIISTEEVLGFLTRTFRPSWLLLAGETAGVLDLEGQVVPHISRANFGEIEGALGGSRGTDVTGGMASKVTSMMALAEQFPGLSIRIFSGVGAGNLQKVLVDPASDLGTRIFHAA